MALARFTYIILSVLLPIMFSNTCKAIKCFDCDSKKDPACLEIHKHKYPKMHAVIPIVECNETMCGSKDKKDFFCRKITQTILDSYHHLEVRITRGCSWGQNERECYEADNMDHVETVCQCTGDLCNAATTLEYVKTTVLVIVAVFLAAFKIWRGSVC